MHEVPFDGCFFPSRDSLNNIFHRTKSAAVKGHGEYKIIVQIVIKVTHLEEWYFRSHTFIFLLAPANSVEIMVKYLMFNYWYFHIFGRFLYGQYTKSMLII